MLELKPCPHCGNRTKPKVMDWDGAGFPGYEVRCDASGWEGLDERGCGAAGGWGETPDEAVTSWNRRTLSTITPAEVGGLVERLRKVASGENAVVTPAAVVMLDETATALEAQAAELATLREADGNFWEAIARAERAEAALAEARKALEEADFWLEGALNCKEWSWDEHQHDAASGSLQRIRAARRALTGGQEDG